MLKKVKEMKSKLTDLKKRVDKKWNQCSHNDENGMHTRVKKKHWRIHIGREDKNKAYLQKEMEEKIKTNEQMIEN